MICAGNVNTSGESVFNKALKAAACVAYHQQGKVELIMVSIFSDLITIIYTGN